MHETYVYSTTLRGCFAKFLEFVLRFGRSKSHLLSLDWWCSLNVPFLLSKIKQVYPSLHCLWPFNKCAFSEDIAIFSDVSKRCNILLSRYIAIQKAQPWSQHITTDRTERYLKNYSERLLLLPSTHLLHLLQPLLRHKMPLLLHLLQPQLHLLFR